MAASGPRFCPRCGTGRIGEMGFCPNCGLDLRQLPADDRTLGERPVHGGDAPGAAPARAPIARREARPERSVRDRLLVPALLVVLLLFAAGWLLGLGPFGRSGDGSGPLGGGVLQTATPTSPFLPPVTSQPSFSLAPGFTAPPVGLTILSPADGTVVGTKEVTVIGTAPPGLRITQDISLGLDRHAMADGTGHWAIQTDLSEGDNQLRFRIGDDPSTTQTIRVIYLPPAS
jgi:hypothetical protein